MTIAEATTTCPHCEAANQSSSSFCESCGKALPSLTSDGPRMVTEASMPSTSAGRQYMALELQKHLKKSKTALLIVAIIQTIVGLLMFGVAKSSLQAGQSFPPVLFITIFGIAAIYFGLYAWARHQPLAAAIVGFTLFVTLHVLDAIADPTQLARGIFMKIIIAAMLVQAIQAGIKYRRLLPQLEVAS